MIELNLLPDIKLEFIKAQRSRRLVFGVAFLASALSVFLLVFMLSVDGLQKKHLKDLTNDIASESSKLQQEPQINRILTVQNQLESLTALHASKPAVTRLFDYLNQVTPTQVNITSLNIDFTQQIASISGTTDALSSVNKYIDTLKYTTYTTKDNNTATKAFSNVVLTGFSVNSSSKDLSQAATYTITLSYDKNIFDITKDVKLTVPNLVTTRAQLDQPTDLFKASPTAPAATSASGAGN